MPSQPHIVHISDNSELAALLEDPDLVSQWLERAGVLFRVTRDEGAKRGASEAKGSDESIRRLDRAIGSWKRAGVEAEAFKEYIRERRKTRNRPSPRL